METEKSRKRTNESKEGNDKPKRGKFKHAKVTEIIYYLQYQKHASLFTAEKPVKGILLSCEANREDRAVTEIIDVLNMVFILAH